MADEFPNWLDMVRRSVTPELWQAIIDAQADKARKGDPKALDFFAECVLPKERGTTGTDVVKTVRLVLVEPPAREQDA